MKSFFIAGLKTNIKGKLLDKNPASFAKAQENALKYEKNQLILDADHPPHSSHPPPSSRSNTPTNTPSVLCPQCRINPKGNKPLCSSCHRLNTGRRNSPSPSLPQPSNPPTQPSNPPTLPSNLPPPLNRPHPSNTPNPVSKKPTIIPYNPQSPPDFSLVPVAFLKPNNNSTNPLEWDYSKLNLEKRCHYCASVMQPNHPCQSKYPNYFPPEVRTLLLKNLSIPVRTVKPSGPPHATP